MKPISVTKSQSTSDNPKLDIIQESTFWKDENTLLPVKFICIKPNKPISIYNEKNPIKSRKLTKNPPWENLRETHMGKPLVLSNLGQEPTQDWNTHNQDNPHWSNNVQRLKAN